MSQPGSQDTAPDSREIAIRSDRPSLTVSLILHDDFSHIAAALSSLYAHTSVLMVVYVTVNSGDRAKVEALRAQFPSIIVHDNDHPLGFAANHNTILRRAETPFVALLNDDIELHPAALDRLVGYLEANPDVALVGPRIIDPEGHPQQSAFSDPGLFRMIVAISGLGRLTRHGGWVRRWLQQLGAAQRLGVESLNLASSMRDVPVIAGVAMVVRRTAYQQVGVMDEVTRFYGEEFGWQWRLRRAGWRVVLVSEAVLTHHNRQQDLSGWKLAEHRKAILGYFQRYRPGWQAAIIRISLLVFHGGSALIWQVLQSPRARDHWQAARVGWSGPAQAEAENQEESWLSRSYRSSFLFVTRRRLLRAAWARCWRRITRQTGSRS